jgi:hypothetical protein
LLLDILTVLFIVAGCLLIWLLAAQIRTSPRLLLRMAFEANHDAGLPRRSKAVYAPVRMTDLKVSVTAEIPQANAATDQDFDLACAAVSAVEIATNDAAWSSSG